MASCYPCLPLLDAERRWPVSEPPATLWVLFTIDRVFDFCPISRVTITNDLHFRCLLRQKNLPRMPLLHVRCWFGLWFGVAVSRSLKSDRGATNLFLVWTLSNHCILSFPSPKFLLSVKPHHRCAGFEMTPPDFAYPPTKDTLADARRSMDATRVSMRALTKRIDAAEAALAQMVRESKVAIQEMLNEKRTLEERAMTTLAYLSPMRRLPLELLREIFLWCFKSHPCSAWVLASVCTSWRRVALKIPVIWSKVSNFRSKRTVGLVPPRIFSWGRVIPLPYVMHTLLAKAITAY